MEYGANEKAALRRWGKRNTAALLSALSMGLGQCYNGQWIKGLLFLVFQAAYLIVFYDLFNIGLWGIVTLGEIPMVDHSIELLALGLIAILLILFGLGMYALNIRDAYLCGALRDKGLRPPSILETWRNMLDRGFPYLVIAPSMVLLVFVVLFPILFMVMLAFTNYDLYHQPPAKLVDYVGLDNFVNLVRSELWKGSFVSVLSWTIVWTFVSTTVQVGLGLILAVLIHQQGVRLKRVFRTILILPWAVPSFVTIIVFSGLFDDNFGAINQMLESIGIGALPWMSDPFWSKVAILLIQFWLGFPFSLALYSGVLQAIPADLYEAADVDGATAWQKFRHITLPMALYATGPLLIVQYVGNFNNFNVIYLFNKGNPPVPGSTAGGTDILISWVYKLTFQTFKYNYAAAVSIVIGVIVAMLAFLQFRKTRAFKEEGMIE
jgi:arabinogalactan oligomer / maltooligosaccharide transport system permease protein